MTTPLQQDGALAWGVLSFVGPGDAESSFDIEAMADGTDLGNPGPVIEIVRSLLTDGSLATITGWDNREAPIRLRIGANDGESAAQAEAALMQQILMDQPYPLIWTPPLGLSAPCVFDTVVAKLDRDTSTGWDLRETNSGDRFYLLTLTCLPFARAVESTIVPALPVPADPDAEDRDVIDDCTSITGWARETNGESPTGPTLVGGQAVQVTAFIDNANDYLRLVRTGAFSVPTDYYLSVDVNGATFGSGWVAGRWRARIDGTYYDPIAQTQDGEDGSTRLFFAYNGAITELAILKDFDSGKGMAAGTTPVKVYNVATTDVLGASATSTTRQQSRLTTVLGAAPTQAQVGLYDATPAALGTDVLVYTTRNTDWRPNLRRWIDDSEVPTTDATMVAGARNTLTTPTEFLIPADLVATGSYALLARLDVDAPGTLMWEAQMASLGGATNLVGSNVIASGEVDLATTSGYEVLDLAALVLPVVEVEGANYAIKITLTGTTSMSLDEAWLFSLDDGVLTWIRDDEEVEWIEIRSPELGAARPSVWGGRGSFGSGSSCIDWKCRSFGAHRFDPGVMQIFTVTTTSDVSQCQLEFFPRFHSHVWSQETE